MLQKPNKARQTADRQNTHTHMLARELTHTDTQSSRVQRKTITTRAATWLELCWPACQPASLSVPLSVCVSAECRRFIVWGGFGAAVAQQRRRRLRQKGAATKNIECRDWRVKHAKRKPRKRDDVDRHRQAKPRKRRRQQQQQQGEAKRKEAAEEANDVVVVVVH